MVRVFLFIFAAAALWAQNAPEAARKAPPEVDAALRARISQFYEFEVQGKFHQAEQLVAEDTKDLFVGSSKPTYYGFELQSITYSDDFTKADVVGLVSRQMPVEGFVGHPVKTKQPSRWKLEKGQWCWYIDPQRDLPNSPFSHGMPPGVPPPTAALPPSAGALPPMPPGMPMPGATAGGTPRPLPPMPAIAPVPTALQADKTSVELKASGPSSDQVKITNPTPFPTDISMNQAKVPGMTIKLDRLTLQGRETATLSIQADGAPPINARTFMIVINVPRTNQVIPIKVSFK